VVLSADSRGRRLGDRFAEWARAPYVAVGGMLDRWYEELPWRRGIPLGVRGERIAERHLKRCGYIILARNYRAAGAEIDLIGLDGRMLAFVEVKTRGGEAFGAPEEAVDDNKQDRIRRAAAAYVEWRRAHGVPIRFDVVAITGAGRKRRLEVIKDAF
jgi:putative endonuclease